MEKSQIYVHVKSRTQGIELLEVLRRHKQQIYESTELGLQTWEDAEGYSQADFPFIFFDSEGEWTGTRDSGDLDKVTILELDELLTSEK